MPTINISRKVIDKIIGEKLPTDKLKDRISMLGTDLEHVDDDEIIVEIFPNRPDMLSEQGFGRALSSFLGKNTGLRKYTLKKSSEKVIVGKGMEDIRPYTVCAIIKNLKLNDERIKEIIQIQEKLHITFCRKRKKAAIGIYPMEKIKFPIHFTAKKPEEIIFRPLEWNSEINAKEILNNHPTGVKYKDLVKKLDKYAVFHDDNNEILSLTPIINSHKTGKITDATKEAFLEVSGFDMHTLNYVLNIMVAAFLDMNADVYTMDVVYPNKTITTPNLNPQKMKFSLNYINKWLGLSMTEKDLKRNLEKMGFGYEKGHALIPAYRADILHPVDLAEDIAIAHGYENFKPEIPTKATTAQEDSFEKFRKQVAYMLAGLNMLETSSYHLSNPEIQFNKMNFKSDDYVELLHSVSEEYNIMRWWMLPNLLQILSENKHNEYPQNIFESGTVFKLGNTETGVKEFNRLACLLCNVDADYTKIRQILDYMMKSLGVNYEVKETEHPSFIPGRVARVSVAGKNIAYIGEIHPQVLENFEIEVPAAAFELNLSELYKFV